MNGYLDPGHLQDGECGGLPTIIRLAAVNGYLDPGHLQDGECGGLLHEDLAWALVGILQCFSLHTAPHSFITSVLKRKLRIKGFTACYLDAFLTIYPSEPDSSIKLLFTFVENLHIFWKFVLFNFYKYKMSLPRTLIRIGILIYAKHWFSNWFCRHKNSVLRISIYYYADPDPVSKKCLYGSGSRS